MDLEDTLKKIIFGKNTSTIKESEKQIEIMADNDFPFLISNLSKILADEQRELKLRIFSSLLLRNSIKKYEQDSQKWSNMEQGFKDEIKNTILQGLISPDKEILNACSSLFAGDLINF